MGACQGSDRIKYFMIVIMIWAVQMAAAFYFCTQKQGFHEDEYYTYYSTARTNGFYIEDGQWMDREVYRNEFVVLPGQRFQYGLVKLVQSWDVHPPMYYWVFHTVASFMPNVFSKWIGLSVNLFFHCMNIILLTYMSYLVAGRDSKLPLLVTLFWGLSPAVMSGVVFIRMYEMLTTFVLLCGILHVLAVRKNEKKLPVIRCLVPMAAVTYLGFLTQYYYFIFLFFLAIAFCIWLLWRDRNIWNCLRYGVGQGIAFFLAYLTYPSFPGQMFRGQRGAQATKSFFDWSNTFERIRFFYDLMNRYVFGHLLSLFLLLIFILAAVYQWNRHKGKVIMSKRSDGAALAEHTEGFCIGYWMLIFASVGYFLTVSKTALLLGDTSNRYQLPVYGVVVLLIFTAISNLWHVIAVSCTENGKYLKCLKNKKYAEAAAVFFCLAAIFSGHWKDGVVFLYPEDCEQTAFADECAVQGIPVVYLYRPGEEWCVWDVTNELMAYQDVCFVSAENDGTIEDGRIRSADSLVVYLVQSEDESVWIERVLASNKNLTDYRHMFEEKYCDVYYFY